MSSSTRCSASSTPLAKARARRAESEFPGSPDARGAGRSRFTCRKAGSSAFLRELIIPFGRSGYVALFEIEDPASVLIVAVRPQLEDDYH
ncbi:MAG: type II toxin-antitoxin system RelE/ParE family toxin [Caldimonas sp.]